MVFVLLMFTSIPSLYDLFNVDPVKHGSRCGSWDTEPWRADLRSSSRFATTRRTSRGACASIHAERGVAPTRSSSSTTDRTDRSVDGWRAAGARSWSCPASASASCGTAAARGARHDPGLHRRRSRDRRGWSPAAIALLGPIRPWGGRAPVPRAVRGHMGAAHLRRPARRDPDVRAGRWLGSGNMAVRRSAFEAVGGFDTTPRNVRRCRPLPQLRAGGRCSRPIG